MDLPQKGGKHKVSAQRSDIPASERALQKLRGSEERLRQIIDTVPALIHTGRPDGYLDFFNQRWLNYVGLSLEEILGWKWTAAIHPEDVRAMVEGWRAALQTGEPYEHESRVRRADGEYRWMLHRDVPLRDERGNIVKWYASSIDIEDRKRAEEASRESEERFRRLVELLPAAVYTCDASGIIQSYNKRAIELWGREPKSWDTEQLFCASLRLYSPEGKFVPHQESPMAEVLKTGIEARNLEVVIERPDRSRITVLVNIVPLRNGGGKLIGAINCFQDITERKRAEEALRESQERWRAVFENSSVRIAHSDPIGTRYLAANLAFQKMVGYTEEELRGMSFMDLTYEDDRKANRQLLSELLAGKRQSFRMEKRYRRKDGRLI